MRIVNILILSFLFLVPVQFVKSQDVELEKDTEESPYTKETGADQKVFRYMFFDFGQIVPDKYVMPGSSWTYAVGMKFKFRLTSVINVVNSYQYRRLAYRLDQNTSKTFPDNIIHYKQRYAIHQFGSDLALRLNIGSRGNSIGWFVDLGGYAAISPFVRIKTVDKLGAGSLAKISKTISRDFDFPQRYEYGLTGRIGYSWFSVYANYRMSEIFRLKYNFNDLSKLVIGVQLGMHK